jgi:HPt (histidine-containing phosphotransfer) domain-containing protein
MTDRSASPIHSHFRDDPDMAELVGLFLTELPERVRAIEQALEARELAALSRLAHQLRGSGTIYGFPSLGRAAGVVEDGLKRAAATPNADLERIAAQVDELVALCRRAALSARV